MPDAPDTPDSRVDRLLSVWQETAASGQDIPLLDLCRDHPTLLGEVRCQVAALRRIQGPAAAAAPPDHLVTLSAYDTTVSPEGGTAGGPPTRRG